MVLFADAKSLCLLANMRLISIPRHRTMVPVVNGVQFPQFGTGPVLNFENHFGEILNFDLVLTTVHIHVIGLFWATTTKIFTMSTPSFEDAESWFCESVDRNECQTRGAFTQAKSFKANLVANENQHNKKSIKLSNLTKPNHFHTMNKSRIWTLN